MSETHSKILVMLPNNLGDVIMATPVLSGLKMSYPGCYCAFFVEEGFEAGLENNPYCDEIIRFPRKKIKGALTVEPHDQGFALLQSCIIALKKKQFDLVINLSQHPYVSYIAALIQSKTVIGQCFLQEGVHALADSWSQYLYAVAFARQCNNLHAADVYRRIAGVAGHQGMYSIIVTEEEKNQAKKYLVEKKIDVQKKIMIFQAGAAFSSKRWPVENFIKLGLMLVSAHWQIIVTGASSETSVARGIEQGIGRNCTVSSGETTFRQSIALCSMAQGCVTADTALMHAAAALGVPTYALFGPTSPVETGPYGNGHFVFSARCPKRPCFETECKTGICMRSVLPETVYACISEKDPGSSPKCDVYKTIVEKNGDFKLMPFSANANVYFSTDEASLTRRAFEPDLHNAKNHENEQDVAVVQTRKWLEELSFLQKTLDDFQSTGNKDYIRLFEQKKMDLEHLKGIGEFWTALLNIRLNSIPLIDAGEGIKKHGTACRETYEQIHRALASYDL
jgi:ADP-heptose:LPS heptosyltransferase